MADLGELKRRVLSCRRCPRLRAYQAGLKRENPEWHCAPVAGFGDPLARVALIGLAPSKTGGNRTSRIFTGDKTAAFLFKALHACGFANHPRSERADDGLALRGIYLTPALKCAPPQDKPTPEELRNCFPFLREEIALLKDLRLVIALGKIAHDAYLKLTEARAADFPFEHGRLHRITGHAPVLDTYHCSPRNTNTGLLTEPMLLEVLRTARTLAR
jgi:uracil-DNA glycosylase